MRLLLEPIAREGGIAGDFKLNHQVAPFGRLFLFMPISSTVMSAALGGLMATLVIVATINMINN